MDGLKRKINLLFESNMSGEMEENVTLIIKTFQRPWCCEKLVASIRMFYTRIQIVVVDDGTKHPKIDHWTNLNYIKLDFDVGVSVGRNAALDAVKTPYFVTLDDDFIFTHKTKIEDWYALLESNPDVDLVGGHVKGCKPYHGCWVWKNDDIELHLKKSKGMTQNGLEKFDITLQFFMARTQKIRAVKWDPELKMTDHSVFFFRCRQHDIVVTYLETVEVDHKRETSEEYHTFRYRSKYKDLAMQKLNAQKYLIIE